jgi:transcriptional regulator with XRE-family HTH domain
MNNNNDSVQTLADLIREHQEHTGDSYADMARKTGISKAKIGQLARPENTYLVRQETLNKLAHGLSLPIATVQRASLGTAGFTNREVQRTDTLRSITDRLEELSPDDVALIADLVESVARHRSGSRRG